MAPKPKKGRPRIHFVPVDPPAKVEIDLAIDPKTIAFQPSETSPKVSVIIPSYGQVAHTLNCLSSIATTPPASPYEILVVEDASGDALVPRLREVSGIRLIENRANQGFLKSCNEAVKLARGEFLFFLNNDTIVHAGAIDDLVHFAQARPETGLVGSKLVYPDGSLQEAGGILWRDGSAWNYGRGQDPSHPHFNYVREADYISGAAILTPRRVWDQLGGFDEHFAPAYCEDSDYAMRIRAAGLKVFYLPTSVVTHMEGVSHGVNVNEGVKSYQIINKYKLIARHGDVLGHEHFPNGERVMRARDRSRDKPVVLIVDHYAPEPDRDAGSRTMIEFIHAFLAIGCAVKLFPENLSYSKKYVAPLQRLGVEVLYGPFVSSLERWLSENGSELDFVLLSRPSVAFRSLESVRRHSNASVLYYGHDLHFARQEREAEMMGKPEKAESAKKIFEMERMMWRDCDIALYPSQEEVDEVLKFEPGVLAQTMPAYAFERFSKREVATLGDDIIFVAGFAHPPNVDAAIWLVEGIFPLILAERPDVRLALIGSNPTEEVRALAGERIEVTGWISDEDLQARYDSARVAVVPLRFGAGVKLKVVEAMREGVPLVTTPVGAQGLHGLEAVVAVCDEATRFAAATLRWLEASDDAWVAASRSESAFAEAKFGRHAMRTPLEKAMRAAAERNANRRTLLRAAQ